MPDRSSKGGPKLVVRVLVALLALAAVALFVRMRNNVVNTPPISVNRATAVFTNETSGATTAYSFSLRNASPSLIPMMDGRASFSSKEIQASRVTLAKLCYSASGLGTKECELRLPHPEYIYDVELKVLSGKDYASSILMHELKRELGIRLRIENKAQEVAVLTAPNGVPKEFTKSQTAGRSGYSSTPLTARGENIEFALFCGYLTGELQLKVIDETGITGFYDWEISRSRVGDRKAAAEQLIADMGLKVNFEKRDLPITIIEQTSNDSQLAP